MIHNTDITRMLAEIKQSCIADSHGGQMRYVREKMIELGFFDTMPESSLDPYRPCPHDWTAFQLALFDNGVPAVGRRKRSYIETTKTRFGGQIKVWTRDKVNFRAAEQISWRANFYLFPMAQIGAVAQQLLDRKQIDAETVKLVNDWVEAMTENGGVDDGWMAAIPVLRTTTAGTRWMKGHLVAVRMQDGVAGTMTLFGPDDLYVTGNSWSEQAPDGKDLADNVVAQMRLGRHAGLDAWATQPSA